jgi:hypothetical protein
MTEPLAKREDLVRAVVRARLRLDAADKRGVDARSKPYRVLKAALGTAINNLAAWDAAHPASGLPEWLS